MRTLIFLAILLSLSITYSISQAQDYDFRQTRWGMSKLQVKNSENSQPLFDKKGELTYSVKIAGINAFAAYYFVDSILVKSAYVFEQNYSNRNDYIRDYKKVKDILTRKYGDPIMDETVWRNDLYRDDPQDYGFAISIGHLVYRSKWITPNTEIKLVLHGNKYKISFVAIYEGIKYQNMIESQKNKKEESQF